MPADRQSCERRVYRLATLLTGNPEAAVAVITAVVDAQPDLRSLDSAHLDRLTVLRSREIPAATLPDDAAGKQVAGALAGMTRQQREAWVFMYVYRMMPRDMAKAMDCSVRAIQQHVLAAEAAMNDNVPGQRTAAAIGKELLDYIMRLDVPAFYRAKAKRRWLWRKIVKRAAIVGIAAALIGGVIWAFQNGLVDRLLGTDIAEQQFGDDVVSEEDDAAAGARSDVE